MNINNHNAKQRKIERESKQHLSKFNEAFGTMKVLGENSVMFTNIGDMNNRLTNLVIAGDIKAEDIEYVQLKGFIDGALQIQLKPQKTDADIINFYTTRNNFEDIYGYIKEERL